MEHNKADCLFLGISIAGFAAWSVSFILMPIEGMGFFPGMLFWSGLMTGVFFQIVLEARRRALFAKYNVKCKTMQKVRNGLLSFGSNKIAIISDDILAVSMVATILALVLTRGYAYICYVMIAITVLSFCLHCVFNGRIYVYVKNRDRIRKALEKKANTFEKGEGEK